MAPHMNEGITKTDHGVSTETPVPGMEIHAATDQDFILRDQSVCDVVDGFQLIEEIGRGGMGQVFRARDLAFDREIALKFLQKKYAVHSLHTLRFLDEARITGQLQHPGIPAVHRVGKLPDDRPYLAMKLIRGYTLSELLWGKHPKAGELPAPHVIPQNYLGIFEAICQAVGYAHAHHVIHRDLKPQNIMVGAFGEVQVMDWGLAKILKAPVNVESQETMDPHATPTMDAGSHIHTLGPELTTAGSILGTPSYMAPEQAIGANSQLDARSDVFGLGAILCAMLTGKPPFQGDTSESTRLLSARGMVSESFLRLDSCKVESELISLAKRCLAPRREDRPENGGAVAQEVARLRAAADERARLAELERAKALVQADEQRSRRRVLLLSGAAIISVLLIGIIGTTWGLIQAAAKTEDATNAARQEHDAQVSEKAQRLKAVEKEEETEAILAFVDQRVFAAARPQGWESGQGRSVTLQQALASSLKDISTGFKEKPITEARVRRTLGTLFQSLGDYQSALEQQRRSFQIFSEMLGADDRQTLLTQLSIAHLNDQTDRREEAQKLRESTFTLAKKRYGLEDQLTLMAISDLADSIRQTGNFQEVHTMRDDVCQRSRNVLGQTNAFTLLCMNKLAQSHSDLNKPQEAIELFNSTLALSKTNMGTTHPLTLDTMTQYAAALDKVGKYRESLPLHQAIFELRQAKLGESHAGTLSTMVRLADCYSRIGRHGEAMPLIELCVKRADAQPGEGSPRLLSDVWVLRFNHFHRQKDVTGCQETLRLWESKPIALIENDVGLARAWSAMSSLKVTVDKKQADKAMAHLQKAVQAGWRNADQLESAKDFDILRNREDFRQLLTTMKAGRQ